MSTKVHHLELKNFKSYYGTMTIGPFHDFTCIVGPNGSGKSNLMDALSFVLGSNTATLRGEKVTDLINKKAKKEGCSVTLVLQMASGQQVKLQRSVASNGTVELAIDGKVVKEADFKLALSKFSIGSRISTFLVFQHEVEAVAQKKSRELTDLLEEVSGSGLLKRDYNDKKRKLDDANEQLTAATLERRGAQAELNQMKLHKKEADRYKETHERLIQERCSLALAELFFLETQLATQKKALEECQTKAQELDKKTIGAGDLKKMKDRFTATHKQYMELLKDNRVKNNELREKKSLLERINVSIRHYEGRLNKEKQDCSATDGESKKREAEMARIKEKLDQQHALLKTLEDGWKKEDAEAEAKGAKLSPEHARERKTLRAEADCQTLTFRQELEIVQRNRDSLDTANKQVNDQLENQESTKKEAENLKQRLENNLRDAQQRKEARKTAHTEAQAQLKTARTELTTLQKENRDREEELRSKEAQLQALRTTRDDGKNASRQKAALADLKKIHTGIRGRLVDLCAPQDKYRDAVTVVMGKWIDAVVVDDMDTAMACVRYLKEQRISPMTFIPLATAKGAAVDDRLRTLGGTCKPVRDCIDYEAYLEPAIRFAVGAALVTDKVDEARRIAYRSDGERHKVVTLDGTILQKSGAVQGGHSSIKQKAAKWDEQHFEKLKEARDKLRKEVTASSEGAEAKLKATIAKLESDSKFSTEAENHAQVEIKQIEARIKSVDESIAKITAEMKKNQDRSKSYGAQIDKLQEKIGGLKGKIEDVDNTVFADFVKKTGIKDIMKLDQQLTDRTKERAVRRQQVQLIINKLTAAMEETRKGVVGARSHEDAKSSFDRVKKELEQARKDLDAQKALTAAVEGAQKEAQKKVDTARKQLDELEAAIKKQTKSSGTEMQNLAAARKQITSFESVCNNLRQQRLALFQRCTLEEVELPTVSATEVVGKKRARNDNAARDDDESDDDGDDAPTMIRKSEAFKSFSESEAHSSSTGARGRRSGGAAKDAEVCIDFSSLPADTRKVAKSKDKFVQYRKATEGVVDNLERELDGIAPNLKASTKFGDSTDKVATSLSTLDKARELQRVALNDFNRVKEMRVKKFNDAFEKIQKNVDEAYSELTHGTRAEDVHGTAYLALEDTEEPYNGGTKYHATPPMKRYMTMDALSGGERTMAALALLFAIHKTNPTPFFVLDEVDAALDVGNVKKLAHYMRSHTNECQYIVVSLKEQLYHVSDALLGVYKDLARESSGTLTLDLRSYKQ